MKQYAVDYLKNTTKSLEYTQKVATEYQEKSLQDVKTLGGNSYLEKIIQKVGESLQI